MSESAPKAPSWHAATGRPRRARARRHHERRVPGHADDHDEGFRHVALQSALLAELVDRARRPRPPRVPAPERPRHAVGRSQRRQRVPARARPPGLHVPDPGPDALVRGLHPRHPRSFMHMEHPATIAELSAHDLGLGAGRRLRDPARRRRRRTEPRAAARGRDHVSIREYYFDWQPREPATFTIECLDGRPVPSAARRSATRWTKRSTSPNGRSCTGTSTCSSRATSRPTTCSAAVRRAARARRCRSTRSASTTSRPTRRCVVDCDVPDSRYWSFHLYRMRWWSPYDIARSTSLNHTQTHVSDDGRIRVVVAHRRSGRRELARHRGPRAGAGEPPVVLAGDPPSPPSTPRSCPSTTSARSFPTMRGRSTPYSVRTSCGPAATTSPGASAPEPPAERLGRLTPAWTSNSPPSNSPSATRSRRSSTPTTIPCSST